MKALLWLLALFVLAVVVSLATRFNEAYLLLVFPSYRAEITLNLALILGTVAFALLYALLRTLTLTASSYFVSRRKPSRGRWPQRL